MDNPFIKNSLKIIRYLAVLRAVQISVREWSKEDGKDNKNPDSSTSPQSSSKLQATEKGPNIISKL